MVSFDLKKVIILQKEILNIPLVTKNKNIDCKFKPKTFLHVLKEKCHGLLILLLLILINANPIMEYHKCQLIYLLLI